MAGNAGDVVIRALRTGDIDKGFFELLSQLTKAPRLSTDDFKRFVEKVDANPDHVVLVAERAGDRAGTLLGTSALLIEHKALRGGSAAGHIEDVVVDSSARGMHVGKTLIGSLVDICRTRGCYKVILDCAESNVPFYERCGFEQKEIQMAQYF